MQSKHALLDITPSAVDRLNYAQFYPVVVFMRAESKHTVKELRSRLARTPHHKSARKLYDRALKLERLWGHIFTCEQPPPLSPASLATLVEEPCSKAPVQILCKLTPRRELPKIFLTQNVHKGREGVTKHGVNRHEMSNTYFRVQTVKGVVN